MQTLNKIYQNINFIIFLIIIQLTKNLTHAEITYIDQTTKGWHIQPLKHLMEIKKLDFNEEDFSNHGCWCGNRVHGGHAGTDLDAMCHQLHQCIKCVEMGDSCHSSIKSWLIDVKTEAITQNPDENFGIGCDNFYNKNDLCMVKKCECTEHVLNKIVKYLTDNPNAESDKLAKCANRPKTEPRLESSTYLPTSARIRPTSHTPTILEKVEEKIVEFPKELLKVVAKAATFIGDHLPGHKNIENIHLESDVLHVIDKVADTFTENEIYPIDTGTIRIETENEEDLTVEEHEKIYKLFTTDLPKIESIRKNTLYRSSNIVEESSTTARPTTIESTYSSDTINSESTKITTTTTTTTSTTTTEIPTTISSTVVPTTTVKIIYSTTVRTDTPKIFAGHDACCGEHPKYFPYNTQNGKRHCCDGKTFAVFNLQCCDNGSIIAKSKMCPIAPILKKPEDSIPTCNSTEILIKNNDSNFGTKYKCEQVEEDSCTSAKCSYNALDFMNCNKNQRLLTYKYSDSACCPEYAYCSPIDESVDCSQHQTCNNLKECTKYQRLTYSMNSKLHDCCPDNTCICDYSKCPEKPKCNLNQKLLSSISDEKCCYEYSCI